MTKKSTGITQLLHDHQAGDAQALEALMPLVYTQLKRIAQSFLKGRRQGGTLVPTVLVHEAFIRLVDNKALVLKDRTHFFSVAARCMRFILTDAARATQAKKRGGEWLAVTFLEDQHGEDNRLIDLMQLENALTKLGEKYPELVQVVELRYLAGLTLEETGAVLQRTPFVIRRQWDLAKKWLAREFKEGHAK